jgi:hypothetical protein
MAAAAASRRAVPPFFDPAHQRGITSLLSQTYGKPVDLKLTKIARPHQEADILAQVVVTKLKDRKNAPRRIIRDAAWKNNLPTQTILTRQARELQLRRNAEKPLTLERLTMGGRAPISDVVTDLALSQVSSVEVEAAGRLSARITANRAQGKVARAGATNKGEAHIVRGAHKTSTTTGMRAGKRRIGSYGIRVKLGHS